MQPDSITQYLGLYLMQIGLPAPPSGAYSVHGTDPRTIVRRRRAGGRRRALVTASSRWAALDSASAWWAAWGDPAVTTWAAASSRKVATAKVPPAATPTAATPTAQTPKASQVIPKSPRLGAAEGAGEVFSEQVVG